MVLLRTVWFFDGFVTENAPDVNLGTVNHYPGVTQRAKYSFFLR
jgi:hypothetical protein